MYHVFHWLPKTKDQKPKKQLDTVPILNPTYDLFCFSLFFFGGGGEGGPEKKEGRRENVKRSFVFSGVWDE